MIAISSPPVTPGETAIPGGTANARFSSRTRQQSSQPENASGSQPHPEETGRAKPHRHGTALEITHLSFNNGLRGVPRVPRSKLLQEGLAALTEQATHGKGELGPSKPSLADIGLG